MCAALAVTTPERASAALQTEPFRYVAMGDSYASGEGLDPFDAGAGDCHRSQRAHPRLITLPGESTPIATDADPLTSVELAACSGADFDDLVTLQLSSLGSDTDLLTISVGGNDAGFAPFLEACMTGTCAQAVEEMDPLFDRLVQLYTLLRTLDATIVVTGYPQLFESPTPCSSVNTLLGTLSINQVEWDNAREINFRINELIEAAALRSGVHYVDTQAHFAGHGLCSADPWIENVHILTFLGFPLGVEPRSFHPTEEGQRQYALAVSSHLAAAAATGPVFPDTGLPLNTTPDDFAAPAELVPTEGSAVVQATGPCGSATATSPGAAMVVAFDDYRAGSRVQITTTVPGQPDQVTTVTADATDVARATITVPASVRDTASSVTYSATGLDFRFVSRSSSHTIALDWFLPGCDTVRPTATISSPFDGAEIVLNTPPALPTFSCADDRAVASCTPSGLVNKRLVTSTLGLRTMTLTATDTSGNTRVARADYRIVWNDTYGSFSEKVVNNVALGSLFTLPVVLADFGGIRDSSTSRITAVSVIAVQCPPSSAPTLPPPALTTPVVANATNATGSGLRIQWVPTGIPLGGCFRFVIALDDGTQHALLFKRSA